MPWYNGDTLLQSLETIHIGADKNLNDTRFAVQTVIRPHSTDFHDFRGYAGRLLGGILCVGDEVVVLPSGLKSSISGIFLGDKELKEAVAPMSITLTLTNDIDISRGNMLVHPNNQPKVSKELEVMLCWFNEKSLNLHSKYIIKHATSEVICRFEEIIYQIDINTLAEDSENKQIEMNSIFKARIRTNMELFTDAYKNNRNTGSIIIINEATNETVAGGMIQ